MSLESEYRSIVARLRGWGFTVREISGCYGRSNGTVYSGGRPYGHVNHHYVCSLNAAQGYIDGLIANLVAGKTINWFADVNGVAYLLQTGPANHAGTGNLSVLSKTKADQPPPGPATSRGDMSGNQYYSGTEGQHPGDATPWPQPLLEIMFAINAASFMEWGYSSNRGIMHYEWTNRKIDMSWEGGPSSTKAGNDLRANIKRYMSGGGSSGSGDDNDMADKKWLTDAQMQKIADKVIATLGKKLVRANKIDEATGKETAHDWCPVL